MRYLANRVHRKDGNESTLRTCAERLGAVWIEGGPWDGWVYIRRWGGVYMPVEIKRPEKQGHADEFTERQKQMREEWEQRGMPVWVWRQEKDVIRDLGGRQ